MDTNFVEAVAGRQRRRHSAEFKANAIEACKPGISMAAVALANGLNANMLRKWVNEARLATRSLAPVNTQVDVPLSMLPMPGFVALRLPEPAPRADLLPSIHLQVQRADLSVKVTWPGALASECAAWLREWLR